MGVLYEAGTAYQTTGGKNEQTRHELSNKQLEVKTNRTSFLCGNRNRHHKTKHRT
jgi:hypothetical protein